MNIFIRLRLFLRYYLKEYHKINQVSVVPINQVNNLMKNQNISLAINIHSFSEMTIDFVKFWIDKINKMKIQYLFIVPNSGEEYKGDLISFDKIDFKPLIESYGYNLIVKRDKYLNPHIQKYGLNPTMYYLFNKPNFIKG